MNPSEDAASPARDVSPGESLTAAVFNSLNDQIAVLDAAGAVVAVNEAWSWFWPESGTPLAGTPVGANYLDTCRRVSNLPDAVLSSIRRGTRAVLEGSQEFFETEYRCGDGRPRWFTMAVTPMSGLAGGAIVAHRDVTAHKGAEAALRQSEEQLRMLLESTRVIPWESEPGTGRFTYVGPQAVALLGYPLEAWYQPGFWMSHLFPDEREAIVEQAQFCTARCRDYEMEYRIMAASGAPVWLHDIVSVDCPAGRPRRLRGFMVDITARKLAEESLRERETELRTNHAVLQTLTAKLLSAQEEERRRLARELHDDLSQRLAALAISVGKFAQDLPATRDALSQQIHTMRQQVTQLSADVHGISRRLHPQILEDLGLVDAIKAECAAFTEREGIAVAFDHASIPEYLPNEIALCLYRVTQEGLRNIAKHACTSSAHVTLRGDDGVLELAIADAGVGFSLAARPGRPGLGLASMEERVRLVRGGFVVRSQPGHGTTIRVSAPVAPPN